MIFTNPMHPEEFDIVSAQQEIAALRATLTAANARIATLEKALTDAAKCLSARAKQFRFYSDQHMAKMPPDISKAATNDAEAALCEVEAEAIAELLGGRAAAKEAIDG